MLGLGFAVSFDLCKVLGEGGDVYLVTGAKQDGLRKVHTGAMQDTFGGCASLVPCGAVCALPYFFQWRRKGEHA